MTVTSVKDAGNVLASLTTNVAAKSTAAVNSVSFQSVWNSQNGSGQQASQTSAGQQEKAANAVKSGDSLKTKESQIVKNYKKADAASGENEIEGSQDDVENLEEAMEVLGTAAMDLINQIADTLNLSPNEVQDLLSDMNLEPGDLLEPGVLSAFLLKACGAEDSMALLTNEELYQNFNQLMGELESILSEDSGIKGMSLGELKEWIEQNPELLASARQVSEEDAAPLIEVTVEEDATADTEGILAEGKQTVDAEEMPTQTQDANSDKMGGKQSEEQKHGDSSLVHHTNPNLQNTEPANPNLQNIQNSQNLTAWDVDTQDIMRQIMDYMRIQVKPDMSQLEMQLHPANLGTLQIHVASKGGVLTANFVTQNEAVKAALESQMVQLKENFSEQGVKVEAIEVTVQTHQFEENLEQEQRGNQNASEKRPKTRRIRLDGSLTMEELNDMGEEEQLAAEMMAASGSTVDYTA